MYVDEGIAAYTARQTAPARSYGRFYHTYRNQLISFLTTADAKIYRVGHSSEGVSDGETYEYIIMSEVLGHAIDVESVLRSTAGMLAPRGRIIITQHNFLWEPVLRLASALNLRSSAQEENWLSPHDLHTFLHLAGFEVVQEGHKMLVPIYVPLLSAFLNTVIANLWPFTKLGFIHYVVARPLPRGAQAHPSISIIIPARNEEGTIARIIEELPTLGAYTEIIFIEGHSHDGTLAEIERMVSSYRGPKRLRYAVQDGAGKGDAVRKGFDMATGDIVTIYDADMTVPPQDMEKFYRAIAENRGEFINGSRLVYPVEKGAMRILNFFGNKFFSLAFTAILGQSLKDTLCGTKMLWREDYERIKRGRAFFGDFDPFGDFDLLFGAAKLNLKIIEVPVRYKERVYGTTNISRWSHGWLLLKMTIFAARKLKFW